MRIKKGDSQRVIVDLVQDDQADGCHIGLLREERMIEMGNKSTIIRQHGCLTWIEVDRHLVSGVTCIDLYSPPDTYLGGMILGAEAVKELIEALGGKMEEEKEG